ncbi:MAG: phosphate/phosphite/phosphonate ABC transporter substrate-binding protein [Jhaorihella sp.]
MIASLGMYDMPAVRGANDRFWSAIRARLGYGPGRLTRGADPWAVWQSPDLLLAQTCGMPYRTRLHGHVTLVATPDHGLPSCPPGHYNSVLVVRAGAKGQRPRDFAGGVFAYNEALSQSGWAAPMTHLGALKVRFSGHVATGAHADSARAVAEGRADMAGLDALTWEMLKEHDGDLAAGLRVIATTSPTPALPWITALGRDPAPIAAAIDAAVGDLAKADRAALHLRGLTAIPPNAYLTVPTPPAP